MTEASFYPTDHDAFAKVAGIVGRSLDLSMRLPEWPFRAPKGNADVCQFSNAIEGQFGAVVQCLATAYGDSQVSLAVVDPTPEYYRANYGRYPAFNLPAPTVADAYWSAIGYEPQDDPTGSPAFTADVVAITGDSGCWAVWAERSWDIALVLSQQARGPWLSAGVEFVPVASALADFTEPDFKTPLSVETRGRFIANFSTRGTLR